MVANASILEREEGFDEIIMVSIVDEDDRLFLELLELDDMSARLWREFFQIFQRSSLFLLFLFKQKFMENWISSSVFIFWGDSRG